MKLAVLLPSGNLIDRRGLINVALSRLEYLEKFPDYEIEVFVLRTECRVFHLFKSFPREISCSDILIDGRVVHQFLKIEYRSSNRLFRKPLKLYHKFTHRRLCDWEWQKSFAKYLKGFDAITAHFNDMAITAEYAHQCYGIPYFVTWHGSDIHTMPFNDSYLRKKTIFCIEHAACNFFVSQALLQKSDELTLHGCKDVLYNGVESFFVKYDKERRMIIRQRYNLTNEVKVVAYIGNLIEIKNTILLPAIFQQIKKGYHSPVQFWIIGDGNEEQMIRNLVTSLDVDCILWGSQPKSAIPDFLNCTDVLVLPSKNEGLPLVTLEAISCGANVVGSFAGGIPETIGVDFCVPFSDTFVKDFAGKVVQVLEDSPNQTLQPCFDWAETAKLENEYYQNMK